MYQSDESKRVQFYQSTAWRKLSRRWLTSNPICQSCWQQGIIRKADVVDHIIELKDDWSRRLDETNLQSLCYKCHIEKTNKERAKRKNKI
jgi:5-methylcytosine-specific restriction endonuclease McrA